MADMDWKEKMARSVAPGLFKRKDAETAESRKQQQEAADAEAARKAAEEEAKKPKKEFVFKKGGAVRGDGVAQRGKTRGRMV